jgi:hypothetical protein
MASGFRDGQGPLNEHQACRTHARTTVVLHVMVIATTYKNSVAMDSYIMVATTVLPVQTYSSSAALLRH